MNAFVLTTIYLLSGETLSLPFLGTVSQAAAQAKKDFTDMDHDWFQHVIMPMRL